MSEWRDFTLADLGKIVTGSTPPKARAEWFGDECDFITPSDLVTGQRRAIVARRLSQEGVSGLRGRVLPPGSICFVCIASIGKLCLTESTAVTNQQINSIVPNSTVDNRYLYYLLANESSRIAKFASGAATPIINKSAFSNVVVRMPDLDAQRRIGALLGALDDLIENNRRRIELLESMARAIYREWFVHFRFPGHEDVPLVDSDLGPIPEGWESPKLSELVSTQYGYTESADGEPIGPHYLRGMDINKRSWVDWSTVPYCPIDDSNLNKFRVQVGDIFVIRMADPGKVGICEEPVEAVFASYLVRLRPTTDRLLQYFLFYTLIADAYQDWVTGASTGATRKSVSAKVMTEPAIALPPALLQRAFVRTIEPMRGELNSLVRLNARLTAMRDLLLPKLVSGEIDVSGLDLDSVIGKDVVIDNSEAVA